MYIIPPGPLKLASQHVIRRDTQPVCREMEAALPPLADISFADSGWVLAAW